MDYIKQISTGEILESGTNEKSTMIQNAVNVGVDKDDIEFGQTDFATMSKWLEEQDWTSKTYADKRKAEYPPIEDVTVALAEKAEGDSTMWDEITLKRQAIKAKYPKE